MIRPFIIKLACLFMLVYIAAVSSAHAHNRSQSYSSWYVTNAGIDMVFSVKAREVTRLSLLEGNLSTLESLLVAHVEQTARVTSSDGADCLKQSAPRVMTAAEGYLRVRVSFHCEAGSASNIIMDSFFAVAPSHVHYARAIIANQLPEEYLFTDSRREHDISSVHNVFDNLNQVFFQYIVLGLEHILGGIDHLVFLAALLLLVPRLKELIWIVTGFTIGHSITLSLAVLGYISLDIWVIEALIGFTIALVAAENIGIGGHRRLISGVVIAALLILVIVSAIWGLGLPVITLVGLCIFTLAYMSSSVDESDVRKLRPALTLVFGLIHGFGFASMLSEVGLSGIQLGVALAGFNVGIEIVQLAVVVMFWLLLRWFARKINIRPWLDTLSIVLCGLGVYWFISRAFI